MTAQNQLEQCEKWLEKVKIDSSWSEDDGQWCLSLETPEKEQLDISYDEDEEEFLLWVPNEKKSEDYNIYARGRFPADLVDDLTDFGLKPNFDGYGMTVKELIKELRALKAPNKSVRAEVSCAKDSLLSDIGEVSIRLGQDGYVTIDGWASNTKFYMD